MDDGGFVLLGDIPFLPRRDLLPRGRPLVGRRPPDGGGGRGSGLASSLSTLGSTLPRPLKPLPLLEVISLTLAFFFGGL